MASSAAPIAEIKQPPLYRRIQQVMRSRIAQGDWAAGQPLPSRMQLCEEFSTTRVTMDKAIQELVREGLLRSAKGSGTFISDGPGRASDNAAPRTLRLGLIMGRAASNDMLENSGRENFYFGPLFQGIHDAIAGQPVEMVYAHPDQFDYASFRRESALDGILLITPLLHELPALHALAASQTPFVAVGMSSHSPADAALPFVDTDNCQGASDAVQYLLELGHRRIAIVNLATSQANHHDRLEGYRRTLAAADVPVDLRDLLLYPIYNLVHMDERIQDWLSPLLASGSLPTALFACDYFMAISTVRVLRRNGLRVPEDISVVGFDDPFSAEHLTPALTTVRQPVYQVGRRSAQRLLDALSTGQSPHGTEVLPTELIVRDSACPLFSHTPVYHSLTEKEGILQ
jgi:DNA-binding LacI/PurR family transcriptional regulator